jgi:hypothetical protein
MIDDAGQRGYSLPIDCEISWNCDVLLRSSNENSNTFYELILDNP